MAPATKRAAGVDVDNTAPCKRARTSAAGAHAAAKALVVSVLDGPENDASQERDVVQLARYARHLEVQLNMMNGPAPEIVQAARKTPEQLAKAAEDIRKAAVEGISKQMTWKPTCKKNSSMWSYKGVCPDPEVFGHLFKLGKPPTWKMKQFSKDEFQGIFGRITSLARHRKLYIADNLVTVRWSDSGEFRLSGTYGTSPWTRFTMILDDGHTADVMVA